MEIAGAFGLEHVVVHDEDPVEDGLIDEKLESAQRTFALDALLAGRGASAGSTVEMLRPDLVGCAEISRRQGEKKGKSPAALDHFDSLPIEQIPARLRALVERIYVPEKVFGSENTAILN